MTTKKMLKQLVANGYVEEGTKLPDKEIRSLYEEMLADEAKIASAKTESEVVPIPEKERLVELACRYDRTTDFIDNYHQQLQAEEKNEKIQAEFIEICTKLGYLVSANDFIKVVSKTGTVHSTMSVEEAVDAMLLLAEKQNIETIKEEESTMKETTNTVTTIKEESIMKKYTEAFAGATTNEDKVTVLHVLLDDVDNIVNVHADNYIRKDDLVKFCTWLGLKTNKKTTRTEAFMLIKNYAAKLLNDNHESKPQQVTLKDNTEAINKTKALLALIKTHAIENKAKGYGYTVSAYMLCAYILQAGHGIMKLKGNESKVTPEQRESVKKVRKWLLDKGYIRPCTYKADDGTIVCTEEYDGAPSHKARMVPVTSNIKAVETTSYKVLF